MMDPRTQKRAVAVVAALLVGTMLLSAVAGARLF